MNSETALYLLIAIAFITLIAAVLAFLAMQTANKNRAHTAHLESEIAKQFALIESGLRHNFQNLGDNSINLRNDLTQNFTSFRQENHDGREKLENSQKGALETFAISQARALGDINQTIKDLLEINEKRGEAIRETLTNQLESLRKENEDKLEKMRATVEEKLQGTLEQRLGESFKLVSDRLEIVHKGLGEMQNLATGVGDLKKVLTNVKSRGTWGEVQLDMLLSDMLTPDQYEKNARVNPEKNTIVEFAIKLPGKFDDIPCFLPIDAKFPQEDYERLLTAQDTGTPEDIDKAEAALERAIKLQAKTISEKYICVPHTTDFAIMYLPTEGLFAETVRKPGFTQSLQSEFRIMVTGPTTLAATLSSLQMGFRTLAIEKRSSEVWQILGAAKAEFGKYGEVWDKLKKQLETAQNTVDLAGKRTRAIERKLRDVESVELPNLSDDILQITSSEQE